MLSYKTLHFIDMHLTNWFLIVVQRFFVYLLNWSILLFVSLLPRHHVNTFYFNYIYYTVLKHWQPVILFIIVGVTFQCRTNVASTYDCPYQSACHPLPRHPVCVPQHLANISPSVLWIFIFPFVNEIMIKCDMSIGFHIFIWPW